MEDHVYSVTELVGSSKTSIADAVRTAVAKASETKPNIRWFEVVDIRGHVNGGEVAHFQVTLKVGSTLEG